MSSNSKLNILKTHKQLPNTLTTVDNKANEAKTKAEQAFQAGSETKQKLVDKLTSIGTESSTSETFESLISKIQSSGIKWATGKANVKSTPETGGWIARLPVTGLDFAPSFIITYGVDSSNRYYSLGVKDLCGVQSRFDRTQATARGGTCIQPTWHENGVDAVIGRFSNAETNQDGFSVSLDWFVFE